MKDNLKETTAYDDNEDSLQNDIMQNFQMQCNIKSK